MSTANSRTFKDNLNLNFSL
jgi:hypothetical protein